MPTTTVDRGLNVKDYGATGDGSTDDTAALQAAIAACSAAGGGVVNLPPGNYRTTGPLYLPSQVAFVASQATANFGRTQVTATGAYTVMNCSTTGGAAARNFRVEGVTFYGANLATCGLWMDGCVSGEVRECVFTGFPLNASCIAGGNCLYLWIERNAFAVQGYAVRLLYSLSATPAAGYYGLNVGEISRNLVSAGQGVRVSGICNVRGNDFETACNSPAVVHVDGLDAASNVNVEGNYFELQAGSFTPVAIKWQSGTGSVSGNQILGPDGGSPPWVVGSVAVDCTGSLGGTVSGNNISRWDTAVRPTNGYGAALYGANYLTNVHTPIDFTVQGLYQEMSVAEGVADVFTHLYSRQNKTFNVTAGLVTRAVRYSNGIGTINLYRGNHFVMTHPSATTVAAVANAQPGQLFAVTATNGNTTLAASAFGLAAGSDVTLAAGQSLAFAVDHAGVVREVGAGSAVFAGRTVVRRTAAPADGDLRPGEMAFWLDGTAGATKFMVKAKDSAGAVRAAAVPLS